MIKNPYNTGMGKMKSYLEKKHPTLLEQHIMPKSIFLFDRMFLRQSRKIAKKYMKDDVFPIFQTIEIETINRCNGKCSFCPVNRNIDPRSLN